MKIIPMMAGYTKSDKEWFPCAYPEADAERESTTFFGDFGVADAYGKGAIRDTYKRCFNSWKNDYKYFSELVVVLNHMLWLHYERGDGETARLYNDLWEKAKSHAITTFKGKGAEHYFKVTD